ncbi:hypothetical protein PISMIDRAFT_679145 [Pisolithus microcarpus 441]|uniref:Uncharacterized protein n=1 Tax=Pisolithus microcarpus 441 TaxID=765257 RepID=A0A0C9Z3K8_9AGAM|nr:hypothetical protein BKA83DRAFT_679145 [Pisolithus microcarpus]KIK23686.1 hypothetical protein PISMIDRAFT_679145 [Pisolithus microcarpus 441]
MHSSRLLVICSASSVSPLHCVRGNLEDVSQGTETPNDGQVLSLKELEGRVMIQCLCNAIREYRIDNRISEYSNFSLTLW